MRYVEINAFARTIKLKEIPKHFYDGMKLLNPNSGMTSLVFEKDNNTVRIFTKDDMKKEWLCHEWGLNLGNHVDDINDTEFKDIHIIDMPKLYPLSPENKKVVNDILKAVKNASKKYNFNIHPYDMISALYDEIQKLKGKAKSMMMSFYNFITNYDPKNQYGLDIALRNFKQTKRGRLVLLDPVADTELLHLFRNRYYIANKRQYF